MKYRLNVKGTAKITLTVYLHFKKGLKRDSEQPPSSLKY